MIWIWTGPESSYGAAEGDWPDGMRQLGGASPCRSSHTPETWTMHAYEVARNATDPVHFRYLHKFLPVLEKCRFLRAEHSVTFDFPAADAPCASSSIVVTSRLKGLYLFGTVALPACIREAITAEAVIATPLLVIFRVRGPLGIHCCVLATQNPVGPLEQEVRWAAYGRCFWGRALAHVMFPLVRGTVEQDRDVWESRIPPRRGERWVRGDGQISNFRRWYSRFAPFAKDSHPYDW